MISPLASLPAAAPAAAKPFSKALFPPRAGSWMDERSSLLHEVCTRIAERVAQGESLVSCVRRAARRWHGRAFKCAPSRKLKLRPTTLFRIYGEWKRGGQVPSAIRLDYSRANQSKVTANLLRAFLAILLREGTRSGRHAYELIGKRRSRGKARARGLPGVAVSYSSLMRRVPARAFSQVRRHRAVIAAAQLAFAKFRLQVEADALATISPAPPKRTPKPVSYEI